MIAASRIAATFWDCGGVLLTNGWDHEERRIVVEHFGLDFAEFERRHPEANDAWERGHIRLEEYLHRTVFYAARSFSPEDFIARMLEVSRVLHPEMLTLLEHLKAMPNANRVKIYMLSNESRELMAYRIPTFGLRDLFDAFLVSAYIGLRKPEDAFYECALEIAQKRPEECVFIDDRAENVAAAEALGIRGVRFETPAQCMTALQQMGIPVA